MNQYAIYLVGMPIATVFADGQNQEGTRVVFTTGFVEVAWFTKASVLGVVMVTPIVTPPEEKSGDDNE